MRDERRAYREWRVQAGVLQHERLQRGEYTELDETGHAPGALRTARDIWMSCGQSWTGVVFHGIPPLEGLLFLN